VNISGSPVSALMPGAALMVGFENGRLYVGTRSRGIHLHPAKQHHEAIAQAWSGGGDLWVNGFTQSDLCDCMDGGAA
jgi:hypothetical protein